MIFFGGLALFLTIFLLGFLWPQRMPLPLGATLWGLFVKSLFFGWFWFYASYHTNLGSIARPLTIVIFVFVLWSMFKKNWFADEIRFKNPTVDWVSNLLVFIAILIVSMPAFSELGSIFTEWDAVASWNRWATGFARNEYYPMNAAYPVLWPAVWSLIYEAQGNYDIWYLAKASIGAPLFFTACYCAYKIKTHGIVSGVMLCAMVYLAFTTQSQFVVSGYMDIPLALIGLSGLLLALDALDADDKSQRLEYLLLASLTVSMSILTKQGGVLIGSLVGLVVLWLFIKKHISFKFMAGMGAIVIVPALTYVQIFLSKQSSLWGNTDELLAVAARKRGDSGVFEHAYSLLAEVMPDTLIPILVLGILLNLIFIRSERGVFGVAALVAGLATFVVFAACCSYGARNGYIIFALLICSAFVGFSSTEQWLKRRWDIEKHVTCAPINLTFPLVLMFSSLLMTLLFISLDWPTDKLKKRHSDQIVWQMGNVEANTFIVREAKVIGKYDSFVSGYSMAKFLPNTRKKYMWCRNADHICINRYLEKSEKLLFHSYGFFETPETREFLAKAVESGQARELAKSRNNGLYEFRRVD